MLVLDKITKIYNTEGMRKTVLKDVSFSIPLGVSVALIGRNGAGKSSLMKIISGQINPTSGTVSTSHSVSWPVGFAGSFHGDLSGAQNARFVARVYGEPSNKVVAFVDDFAELGPELFNPVRTYSSGMRSRLAFAISMAIDFDFYLIDEVTSVGDANFRKKSSDTLLEKTGRCGALVVSHSDETLKKLCSSCIVIENAYAFQFDTVDGGIGFYNWCRKQYGPNAENAKNAYEKALDKAIQSSGHKRNISRNPNQAEPSHDAALSCMQGFIDRKEWDEAESLAYHLISECIPGAARAIKVLGAAFRQDGQGRWLTLARVATHAKDAGPAEHAFLAENLLTISPPPLNEVRSQLDAAFEKSPDYAPAHYAEARLHFLHGSIETASRSLEKARENAPDDPKILALGKEIDAKKNPSYELTNPL